MTASRVVRAALISGLMASSVSAATAWGSTTGRVAAVNDSARVTMQGSVSPRTQAAADLGLAPADKVLPRMSLRFNMTATQQSTLTQLIADQQNPASGRYHQWLTPEQFGAQFGVAATDLAKVTGWLASQGFTVTGTARGGLFVTFSGTVAQANRAFQTEIHSVQLRGVQHVANVRAPTLPRAIAAVTQAVAGLDDFTAIAPELKRSETVANPQYTSAVSGNHYLAPGDFYTIYDEKTLLSSSVNGSGVTIAVVGQSDINLTDVAAFRVASGLSANAPTVKLYGADPGAQTSTGDQTIAEMAVEWSGAVAPSASILYVNSTNVIDGSLTEAIDNDLAPVISDSYGECEAALGANTLAYYNTLLAMAATEGITITAPAGDSGATACDAGTPPANNGLAISFPADSPYVTAVGGTEFNEGAASYFAGSNGANAGSAVSYIPEVVWNDDSVGTPNTYAASGGGASLFFSKPSWQVGSGVQADYSRDVPDVSLSASKVHDPYLICEPGYCLSGFAAANSSLDVVGGTEMTSPLFAGLIALVVQKTGAAVGVAGPKIYALANSSFAGNVFHDVTAGTNASVCTQGTPNCPNGGTIGFSATAGYDQATGWGSVDAFALVNDWTQVTALASTGGSQSTITNLTGNANSVSAGMAVMLTATVTPTAVTGTVEFTVDGVAAGSGTVASGIATYSLATGSLTSGAHLVQATYSGDTTYSGSKGAFSLNITSSTLPDFTLTPATATVTVKSGGISPGLTFTVTPVNGFTGSVSFQASAPSTVLGTPSFSLTPVTVGPTAPATTVLTLFAYEGGNLLGSQREKALPGRSHGDWEREGTGVFFAGMLLLLAPRRRRLGSLLMGVLAVAAIGLSGCLSSTPIVQSTQTNTPPGTYTITVSATSVVSGVATTHSAVVTWVVQ